MRDSIQDYLTAAGEQIRWDRARPALLTELEDHLLSEAEACEAAGLSKDEAQAEAVRQMGDPVIIGQELDRVHRPKPQWELLGLTLLVSLAVTVLRVELTKDWWVQDGIFWGNNSGHCYLALFLGTALLLAGYFLDYTFLAKWGNSLFPLGLLFGFLFLPYWFMHVDPYHTESLCYYAAHVFLLAIPVCYGGWLYAQRKRTWKGFLLSTLPLPLIPAIAYSAHYSFTLGVGSILILSAACLLLLAVLTWADWFGLGKRLSRWLATGLVVMYSMVFLYFVSLLSPAHSLSAAFHPELYYDTYGQTAMTVRHVLEGAQWFGPSEWMGQYYYWESLSSARDSFFLTTVLQRLGWGPYLLLTGGFVIIALWLLVKGLRQRSILGRIVSLSVALPFLLQTIFGVMTSLGFIWFAVPFPLVGGNCILSVQMALIGLVLSVFRQESLPTAEVKIKPLFFFLPEVR